MVRKWIVGRFVAESSMKTLKHEEVLVNEYNMMEEAYASIAHFLEVVYNQCRLHSSLGYKLPVEFEADFYAEPSSTLTNYALNCLNLGCSPLPTQFLS